MQTFFWEGEGDFLGGGYYVGFLNEGIFRVGTELSMEGNPNFPVLSKKRSEIKLKKNVFSNESKEQH